jgi:hypothetical protein
MAKLPSPVRLSYPPIHEKRVDIARTEEVLHNDRVLQWDQSQCLFEVSTRNLPLRAVRKQGFVGKGIGESASANLRELISLMQSEPAPEITDRNGCRSRSRGRARRSPCGARLDPLVVALSTPEHLAFDVLPGGVSVVPGFL